MNIFIFVTKVIVFYVLSCVVLSLILLVVSTIFDVESVAWTLYDYLYSNFALYEDIYKYDFNPALGDFLIAWMFILPALTTFIVLMAMRYLTGRRKK